MHAIYPMYSTYLGKISPFVCLDIFIQTSNDESPPENSNLLNDNFYVAKTTESTSLDLKSFFSIVYHLLFKSASKSDALAHFLMALANRLDYLCNF